MLCSMDRYSCVGDDAMFRHTGLEQRVKKRLFSTVERAQGLYVIQRKNSSPRGVAESCLSIGIVP